MTDSAVAHPVARREPRTCVWLLLAFALAYAVAGVGAMLALAPRVPYADQWRHYAHLLTRPFPASVFEFDNGHAEVLPNLLRLLDLRCLGGQETLQILCAVALALCAAVFFLRAAWDCGTAPALRAAQTLVVVLGVFWLGNLRALTQPGDGVHVYLVLTCLGAALCLIVRGREPSVMSVLLASASCLVASFSFGAGIASFVAVLAVLFVRGVRNVWQIPAAAALVAAGVYVALTGWNGEAHHAVLPSALTALRVLGAPFVYVALPLLDPAAAAAVPAPLRGLAVGMADAWTAQFGAIRSAVFPQAAFGIGGMLWLLTITLRSWHAGNATRARCTGIGLAFFGAVVAALIALARQDYFMLHAEQIGAPRYVPWSSLFWAGLLLAQLDWKGARITFLVAASLPLSLLPSEIGMATLARRVREVAEDTALYAVVGVLPQDAVLGETDPDDVRAALPALRDAGTAMFAWPQTLLLESGAPIAARTDDTRIDSVATPNRLGRDGRLIVDAQLALPCPSDRALVVEQGRTVGLLRRGSGGRWHGVARGAGTRAAPTLATCER